MDFAGKLGKIALAPRKCRPAGSILTTPCPSRTPCPIPPPTTIVPQDEAISPEVKKETTRKTVEQENGRVGAQRPHEVTTPGQAGDGEPPTVGKPVTAPGDGNENGPAGTSAQVDNDRNNDRGSCNRPAAARHRDANFHPTAGGEGDGQREEQTGEGAGGGVAAGANDRNRCSSGQDDTGSNTWRIFRRNNNSTRNAGDTKRRQGGKNKKILPFEGGLDDDDASREGEALTDPLVLAGQQLSTHVPSPVGDAAGGQGLAFAPPER